MRVLFCPGMIHLNDTTLYSLGSVPLTTYKEYYHKMKKMKSTQRQPRCQNSPQCSVYGQHIEELNNNKDKYSESSHSEAWLSHHLPQ